MPDNTLTPEQQADHLLTETVSIPEFTRKLASDFGFTPDEQNHVDIRVLADDVYRAAHHFATKRASQAAQGMSGAVKSAIDAAYAVAGKLPPSRRTGPNPAVIASEYEKLAGVMDAAALLTGGKPAEEEEEDKKKAPAPCTA